MVLAIVVLLLASCFPWYTLSADSIFDEVVPEIFLTAYSLLGVDHRLVLDLQARIGTIGGDLKSSILGQSMVSKIAKPLDVNFHNVRKEGVPFSKLLAQYYLIDNNYHNFCTHGRVQSAKLHQGGKIRLFQSEVMQPIYLQVFMELLRLEQYKFAAPHSIDTGYVSNYIIKNHRNFLIEFVTSLYEAMNILYGESAEWCFDIPVRAFHVGMISYAGMVVTRPHHENDIKAKKKLIVTTSCAYTNQHWTMKTLDLINAKVDPLLIFNTRHLHNRMQPAKKYIETYTFGELVITDYLLLESPSGISFALSSAMAKYCMLNYMSGQQFMKWLMFLTHQHVNVVSMIIKGISSILWAFNRVVTQEYKKHATRNPINVDKNTALIQSARRQQMFFVEQLSYKTIVSRLWISQIMSLDNSTTKRVFMLIEEKLYIKFSPTPLDPLNYDFLDANDIASQLKQFEHEYTYVKNMKGSRELQDCLKLHYVKMLQVLKFWNVFDQNTIIDGTAIIYIMKTNILGLIEDFLGFTAKC